VSTHADYRQRSGKLEADFRLAAGIPAAGSNSCRCATCTRTALRANVDVRAPFIVLAALGRRLGRRLLAGLLTALARGAIAVA
jgi:hypothetical protein